MKVTVINGNAHHGSTWHCMDLFRQEFMKYGEVEFREFILPSDMPNFCVGCFSCFMKGEQKCPDAAYVSPIVRAMEEADVVVITSSVYGLDVTGQLKALLDHLCFMWISHRPNPKMFKKVGLTVVTTAGAGLSHTTKTIRNSLTFWGFKKVYSFKKAVAAAKWEEVSDKKMVKIEKQIASQAKKIVTSVNRIHKLRNPIFRSFMFHLMKGAMKNNNWNPTDRKHWEEQGWLNNSKPF